jgi:hypothetical protein
MEDFLWRPAILCSPERQQDSLLLDRVSFETSFVSKQPKLVLALSETRHLFWLFRFNIETGSFGVSKQPKQTKDQPKQQICYNINLFRQSSVCFGCFNTSPKHRNKLKKMFFGFAKQTKKQPKQIVFRFKTKTCFIVLRTPYILNTLLPENTEHPATRGY